MTHCALIRPILPAVLIAAISILSGCAPGLRVVSQPGMAPVLDELSPYVSGESAPFKGSGSIVVRVDKAEYKGRMDIAWRSDDSFSCALYDPLGNQIARLWAAEGRTRLDYGDASLPVDAQTLLHIPGILPESPITFRGFVRILAGCIPYALPDQPEVDSLLLEGRKLWFHFSSESGNVRVAIDKRSGALREAVCASPDPRRWQAGFSDFRDGLPRRIRIELAGIGSFEVRYDRIIVTVHAP